MNSPAPSTLFRFDAHAAIDAAGLAASPASVLVEFADRSGEPAAAAMFPARVLAVGTPHAVDRHQAARSPRLRTISRPRSILIPGLVNAHTHLDLTHIGPQPHDPSAGFMPWIDLIRTRRQTEPDLIAASVRRGIALSLAAGTVAVGDIAGAVRARMTFEPWRTLCQSPLVGVSWLEFFGIGKGRQRAEEMLDQQKDEIERACRDCLAGAGRIRLGLQPHAPNTVARSIYLKAVAQSMHLGPAALSTHLAESPEERAFVGQAAGPQRTLLESLGLWDDSIPADLGKGLHPVKHLEPVLRSGRFTVAHVNDATDEAVEILARTGTRVVYCPRASTYFGAATHFGPHRYRDMLKAGIPVALGTDSVVNLPPEAGVLPSEGGRGVSILDEMRHLHARDATPPLDLLRMATLHGAEAVGLLPEAFTLAPEAPLAGLLAVPLSTPAPFPSDPATLAERILTGNTCPEFLFANTASDLTENRGQ